MVTTVIDTSYWRKGIYSPQAEKLHAGGVRGIITRATIGTEVDETAFRFVRMGKNLKWVTGVYHFLRPGDGHAQALNFINVVGDAEAHGHVLDIEVPDIKERDVYDFLVTWLYHYPDKPLGLYTRPSYMDARNWTVWAHFPYYWMAKWPGSVWLPGLEGAAADPAYSEYPFQQFGSIKYSWKDNTKTVGGSFYQGTQLELYRTLTD